MDGVDFVPEAIQEATRRAEEAGLAHRVTFHQGSVAELDFLAGPYDFALDVGCAHGLSAQELRTYHQGLLRLVRPGGVYLLFAHLSDEEGTSQGAADEAGRQQRWIKDRDLQDRLGQGFISENVIYGQTQVNDQAPWRSAWYWFRRAEAGENQAE
jgi:cyclopropane fatty-acyl-phospholipid synthase-like methyltransferase